MSTSKKQRPSWLTILLNRMKWLIDGELNHLLTINKSGRPWHIPLFSATTISFPVFVSAYFDALSAGIISSLGAMVILNLPLVGKLPYRLITVMGWGFGMSLCFALGLLAQQIPILILPVFALISLSVVLFSRYYQQPPPGGLFIMMAGAVALFMPITLDQMPHSVGLIMLGSAFAVLMALPYSLFLLLTRECKPAPIYTYQADIISESVIVAGFVTLSLVIAVMLNMSHPYWAAVSCFIIIQGIHLRTIWIKQVHRLLGTLVGAGLASWMLSWGLSVWSVAASVLVMILCIEALVDRHYGLAVIFITPLTIFIAEYGSGIPLMNQADHHVTYVRLVDTAIGCVVALVGGVVMHSTNLRVPLRWMENWILARFK